MTLLTITSSSSSNSLLRNSMGGGPPVMKWGHRAEKIANMPPGPSLVPSPTHRAVVAPADGLRAVVAELHLRHVVGVRRQRALRVPDEFRIPIPILL